VIRARGGPSPRGPDPVEAPGRPTVATRSSGMLGRGVAPREGVGHELDVHRRDRLRLRLRGAVLGMALRPALPVHHLSEDSRDTVKLRPGSSRRLRRWSSACWWPPRRVLRRQAGPVERLAADVIAFDRSWPLRPGGRSRPRPLPEDRRGPGRRTWPRRARGAGAGHDMGTDVVEAIQHELAGLSPDAEQAWLRSRASRGARTSRTPLGACWFSGAAPSRRRSSRSSSSGCLHLRLRGLLAPPNGTVRAVLLVAALSVSATILLILELDRPTGLISISGRRCAPRSASSGARAALMRARCRSAVTSRGGSSATGRWFPSTSGSRGCATLNEGRASLGPRSALLLRVPWGKTK